MLDPRSRPCVDAAYTLYSEILDRIESIDFAIFSQRATVGTARRLQVAGVGLVRAWRARIDARQEDLDMDRWQYLIVLAACLVITAPLETVRRRASTGRHGAPQAPCCRLRPCSSCGMRWRSPRTSGPTTRSTSPASSCPLGIPIEELLFFIVIPLCGLLTYNAVDTHPDAHVARSGPRSEQSLVTGLGYTLPAVLAVIAVCALEFGVLRHRAVPQGAPTGSRW